MPEYLAEGWSEVGSMASKLLEASEGGRGSKLGLGLVPKELAKELRRARSERVRSGEDSMASAQRVGRAVRLRGVWRG